MHTRPTNAGQLDSTSGGDSPGAFQTVTAQDGSLSLPILQPVEAAASEGGCACGSNDGAGSGCCGSGGGASESPSKVFWRSLDDKNSTDEYLQWRNNEFQEGASEATDDERRTFMKLMGASAALAGLAATGCRRLPEQHILPYAQRPDNRVPGSLRVGV